MGKVLYTYFGHHKCATTWVADIIREVCRPLDLKFTNVHSPIQFNKELKPFVEANGIDFLAYINADSTYTSALENFRGFHLIRDPRDIVVSAYFSHLYSHPTEGWPALIAHRERLKQVSKEEGLLLEIDFSQKVFADLYNWDYGQPHVLELRMEELIHAPYETMVAAFSFLGLVEERYSLKATASFLAHLFLNRIHRKSRGLFPWRHKLQKIPVQELLGIVYGHRFSTKTQGRKQGEEDVKSHYRKGAARDWVNHFNAEHRTYFKQRYNDLLLKLGYETTPDWE